MYKKTHICDKRKKKCYVHTLTVCPQVHYPLCANNIFCHWANTIYQKNRYTVICNLRMGA